MAKDDFLEKKIFQSIERKHRYRLEKIADVSFLIAISCIVLASILIVLDFI